LGHAPQKKFGKQHKPFPTIKRAFGKKIYASVGFIFLICFLPSLQENLKHLNFHILPKSSGVRSFLWKFLWSNWSEKKCHWSCSSVLYAYPSTKSFLRV